MFSLWKSVDSMFIYFVFPIEKAKRNDRLFCMCRPTSSLKDQSSWRTDLCWSTLSRQIKTRFNSHLALFYLKKRLTPDVFHFVVVVVGGTSGLQFHQVFGTSHGIKDCKGHACYVIPHNYERGTEANFGMLQGMQKALTRRTCTIARNVQNLQNCQSCQLPINPTSMNWPCRQGGTNI